MPTTNYTYLAQFEPGTYHPVFDPTGLLPANVVTGEVHTITPANDRDFHFIVPIFAPFFKADVELIYEPPSGPSRTLVEGDDYLLAFEFIGASRGCAKPVYGGISFLNNQLTGKIRLNKYRTIGGNWCLSLPLITQILANGVNNPRTTAWEQVTNYPTLFPVIDHEWNLVDMVGMSKVVEGLSDIADAIANRPVPVLPVGLTDHLNDFNNPHQVTKAQVGLGLANNYATATNTEAVVGTATDKHVTPAGVKAAVDQAQGDISLELQAHITDLDNPHEVTKLQVGLGNVQNYPIATQAEAQAHVANDRYMTPARTWDEILFSFGSALNAALGNVTVSGVLTVANSIRVAQSTGGVSGGFLFSEPGIDTGLVSPGDNVMDVYSAGQNQMRFDQAQGIVQMFRRLQGATLPTSLIGGDSTNNGSFTCRADGAGDYAVAGMSFHNNNYAIKMGVRSDGFFGLGGWSRGSWSLYSDPGGNLVAAGNVVAYSDPRLKENERDIVGASKLLRELGGGKYFTWKHGIAHTQAKAGKQDIGVMANDNLLRLFPEMVVPSISIEGVTYNMVAYEKFAPVLISAHNEHDVRIEQLEQQLAEALAQLKTRDSVLSDLTTKFDSIMRRLSGLENKRLR